MSESIIPILKPKSSTSCGSWCCFGMFECSGFICHWQLCGDLNMLCTCYIFMWKNISDRNSHVGRHVLFSNDHPYSSSDISITWVTVLHPLYSILVLLHSIWHPLSFEQIPLIQIYQINHIFIKTINFQLFLLPWKTLRLFTFHTTIIILCSFTHKKVCVLFLWCFLQLLKFCGLKNYRWTFWWTE